MHFKRVFDRTIAWSKSMVKMFRTVIMIMWRKWSVRLSTPKLYKCSWLMFPPTNTIDNSRNWSIVVCRMFEYFLRINRGVLCLRPLHTDVSLSTCSLLASLYSSSLLAVDSRPPSTINRDSTKIQPTPAILNTFGHKPPSASALTDLTNSIPLMPLPPSTMTSTPASTLQPRHIPIKKDALLSNGVGFNFRTTPNDSSSNTPYSHIITSVDNTNSIGSQGLRLNDYILSINDENVEYLNHDQLEDKLRRAPNSETMRLLVADGNVYHAYKRSAQNQGSQVRRNSTDRIEPPKIDASGALPQNRRQYRLQRNPDFEGYGFRVRSNYQADGTPHQIVSVEPGSPADLQGLRVRDYILRVNNQTVEHMNPTEFNQMMQNLVRNDNTRDGTLLLEVMDEGTYRANSHGPPVSSQYQPSLDGGTLTDRHTPTRPTFGNYPKGSALDEAYPKMRQCFIRVRRARSVFRASASIWFFFFVAMADLSRSWLHDWSSGRRRLSDSATPLGFTSCTHARS